MKKILLTFGLIFVTVASMTAQTVDDIFNEFKDKENVECITIPGSMMGMASSSTKKEGGNDFLKKVSSVRVLNIENDNALQQSFCDRVASLKKQGYETMVNSNEENEKTQILFKTKEEIITEMVVIHIELTECALVQINGEFKPSDTQTILDKIE